MTEGQPNSKCNYFNRLCNRHKINVGDFFIIKRRVWRSKPKQEASHLHICISGYNFGVIVKRMMAIIVGFFVFAALGTLYFRGDLTGLAIYLAFLAVVMSAINAIWPVVGDPRPSYGELLLSLFRALTVFDRNDQKQCLVDAALRLYSIDACTREGLQELLKWINHSERTYSDYYELAVGLNKLLCT